MKNEKWEMGDGKWEMGNGKWEMGNGKWEMGNGEWGMGNDGRISEAPFVSPFYAPHSASLHVGFSTIYASPKRIRILRIGGGWRR